MIRRALLPVVCLLAACAGPPVPTAPHDAGVHTVFVIRHAEAFKNLSPIPDLPPAELDSLTEAGQAQAKALADWLRPHDVSLILHSPTGRTTETATLIAQALRTPARASEALAPLSKGEPPVSWNWREANWSGGQDPTPPGGESLADGVKRAMALIADSPTPGALVLVSHGDVCAGVLGEAAKTPIAARWSEHAPPGGSVTTLILEDGVWTLGAQWTP